MTKRKQSKKRRRWWIHPINKNKLLYSNQFFDRHEKIKQFPDNFFSYYRMSVNSFDELVQALREDCTTIRRYISLEEKITITLR